MIGDLELHVIDARGGDTTAESEADPALLLSRALELRCEVFTVEQGVPIDLEFDGADSVAVHVVAVCNDRVVGTLRMTPEGHAIKIGRMAVCRERRGRGIGSALVGEAFSYGRANGHRVFVLHAQLHAQGFYEKLGFVAEGGVFDEAGIAHVRMSSALAAAD